LIEINFFLKKSKGYFGVIQESDKSGKFCLTSDLEVVIIEVLFLNLEYLDFGCRN